MALAGVLALLALIAASCAPADGGGVLNPEVVAGSSPETDEAPETLSREEALRADAAKIAEEMGGTRTRRWPASSARWATVRT